MVNWLLPERLLSPPPRSSCVKYSSLLRTALLIPRHLGVRARAPSRSDVGPSHRPRGPQQNADEEGVGRSSGYGWHWAAPLTEMI